VAPDENLHKILLLMSNNQISRVIVTRDHKTIGIVTGHDLLSVSILLELEYLADTGKVKKNW